MNVNTKEIAKACDRLKSRCTLMAAPNGEFTYHNGAWLSRKMTKFFHENPAAEAVTIPVFVNAPVIARGYATIHRDGQMQMRVAE